MTPANENKPKASAGKCPTCGKPSDPDYRPFCSKRCADVDLQRWLSGRYAIPAVEDDEDRDENDQES
ncbi:DNA gyrase inhibitor YacG [Microvirga puerhi]|uniref:DNA gyrase inhibitor YacG n=1 Tax=Microvirga puerhi TaxID=2876078 RepID=A0ABS7VLY7_9HYPH|nr:DNA gyrase inhibitor YacG [Microvirga puerhi]MBZ6076499.1 DNA gyrase inhibitor YacG [Microvirga puerhi]